MKNSVVIDRAVVDDALEWAKKFCPSYITNGYHMETYNVYNTSKFEFFFSDPKDMTAFKLRFL